MDKEQKLKLIQRYIANWAIGPTTLRSQGKGVTKAAREFLTCLGISILRGKPANEYRSWLDKKTNELMKWFPKGAKNNWGAARKAINVFMVMAYFNKELAKEYNLQRFNNIMETPLDNRAAKKLKAKANEAGERLPAFKSIKRLNPRVSKQYQDFASRLAKEIRLPRGELDILLWPNNNE